MRQAPEQVPHSAGGDDNALTDEFGIPYKIYASCQYVTQDGKEKVALACANSMILYYPTEDTYEIFNYPTGRSITTGDSCMMLQAVGNLYIFRGFPETMKEVTLSNTANPHTTVVANCTAHGYQVGDEIVISDIDPASPVEDFFTTA